jgi:hypothetical protein
LSAFGVLPVHSVETLEKITRLIGIPMLCFPIFKDRFRQISPAVVLEMLCFTVCYDRKQFVVYAPKIRLFFYIAIIFFCCFVSSRVQACRVNKLLICEFSNVVRRNRIDKRSILLGFFYYHAFDIIINCVCN